MNTVGNEKTCPKCKGAGKVQWEDEVYDCTYCNGVGTVPLNSARIDSDIINLLKHSDVDEED